MSITPSVCLYIDTSNQSNVIFQENYMQMIQQTKQIETERMEDANSLLEGHTVKS